VSQILVFMDAIITVFFKTYTLRQKKELSTENIFPALPCVFSVRYVLKQMKRLSIERVTLLNITR
jgi:hypothetical protein